MQVKRHLPCRIMIIDFNHSFKDYHEILNFYGVWDYACPNPECRAKHHPMRRHGRYGRSLVLWDSGACLLMEGRMEILRLKCISCGSTHAVLPMDVIPFFAYSVQAVLALLSLCMEENGSVVQTEKETGVSCQLLCRFLRIFHEYSGKLMLFLRREALWEGEGKPAGNRLLALLYGKSPPWPQSSFFRVLRVPLFLHRRSTVSYPLRFGAAMP